MNTLAIADKLPRWRGRAQLLGLLAVVLGPMLLASAMYHGQFWLPQSRSYHGELIASGQTPADLGVAGKDVLLEYGAQNLYEPLDLQIARCKLMTAGAVGAAEPRGRLRVATKFVNVAKRYYAEQGRQVDIIKLYGSMELAPLVGLADKIIDVVDTGNTLRANGLEPQELIAHISSRLVVNKASMKMQHARIQALIDTLRQAVASRHDA